MPLPKLPFVVLDTETTGLVPKSDKIVEIAIQRFEEGERVAEYESLFSVNVEIGPVARVLTRIAPDDLRGKPTFADEQAKIEKLIEGAVIIGQNVGFDIGMIKGEGLDLTERPQMDSAMIASLVFPEAKSFSLSYLSSFLDLPHEPIHRAMGDVTATTALVEKAWERLNELPEEVVKKIKMLAEKGPESYAGLFGGLGGGGKGEWLKESGKRQAASGKKIPNLKSKNEWFVVKNLDTALREYDCADFTPVFAPQFVLDPQSVAPLLKQEVLTADELTLAIKILLYSPKFHRDLPLHGGERDVWKGKLACTKESKAYTDQFGDATRVILDHRQLLDLLVSDHNHSPPKGTSIVIDDASMLEDTATKAFKWTCGIEPLRAACAGVETPGAASLQSFLDALQIWIEKVRNFQDIRYFVEADFVSREARGIKDRLDELLKTELTSQVRERLEDLARVMTPKNLNGRIAYIECFRDGGQIVQSVPFDVAGMLGEHLYAKYETSLLLPPGEEASFASIIPPDSGAKIITHELESHSPLTFADEHLTLERLLPRVDGRVICLVGSKRSIEQLAVKFIEPLEEQGITLIAQGLAGGLGRMQAEFQTAGERVVWMMTPWMYEGVELPLDFVDHLWIHTLPFDHPKHAVLSRRAEKYGRNVFDLYFVPRLLHRLFRLLRMYGKHRKEDGDIIVLDQRLKSKGYGKRVIEYLRLITTSSQKVPVEG